VVAQRILYYSLVLLSAPTEGAVLVNPPEPITHRVQVQPIIAQDAAGTAAVFFGNPTEEAYIREQVNAIWAQVGVRVDWLAPVVYPSAFALDGWPANYTTVARPTGDLGAIINGAGVPPKSANAIVLNVFFVDVVPAFSRTSPYTSNGYARIDANGMAVHVGEELLAFIGGRDVIAGVFAHEIGHNLGLDHTANGGDNLMSPNGTSDRLTASQKAIIFTNNGGIDGYDFLQPVAAASNYSQWASAQRLVGGATDDDDGDGIPHVVEFMLGLQGRKADGLPVPVATRSGITWTLPKASGALADGLVYAVEVSADGTRWVPAGSAGSGSIVASDGDGALVVEYSGAGGGGLLRMAVALPANLSGESSTFIPLEVAAALDAGRVIRETACGCAQCASAP